MKKTTIENNNTNIETDESTGADSRVLNSTKQEFVPLPKYTKGEEIFNAVSHIVGAAFGIFALIVGIVVAVKESDGFGLMGMIIYGISMILLFTMSSIYHFLRPNRAKKVFRVLDHCAIFLLIAGTYTPICLTILRNEGVWGWLLLCLVWALAVLGLTLTATMMEKVKVFSMICYIGMGWCVVIAVFPLVRVFDFAGLMWLLGGGIAYTLGAVLYGVAGRKKIKYLHSVWHLFILLGAALQFVAIIVYALPL